MGGREHDRLTRWVFGRTEEARALLRALLPHSVVRDIDWSTIRLAADSLVDERLKLLRPDLIFEVEWRGTASFLSLVLEHQSTPRRRVALRMLSVTVGLSERWCELHPQAGKLPLVLPVVLYHGTNPWNEPLDVRELFDQSPADVGQETVGSPSMRYYLIDLGEIADETLRALSMSALGRLTLLALKHGRTHPDLPRFLVGCAQLLRELRAAPRGRDALVTLLLYTLRVNPSVETDDLVAVLEREVDEEVAVAAKTAGDRLIEQGRLEGERELLRRLLAQRFGPLGSDVVEKLDRAGGEQLEHWALRVLSASCLEGVFQD